MKRSKLTRTELERLVLLFGGDEAVRGLIERAQSSLVLEEDPKYGSLHWGHVEMILVRLGLGRQDVGDLIHGGKRGKATLYNTTPPFFDQHGRAIPFQGMTGVVDANPSFRVQPDIDSPAIHARYCSLYGDGVELISLRDFERSISGIIDQVSDGERVSNLLRGPYLPFILPPLQGDIGWILDETLIPALERAYLAQFSGHKFTNYRHDRLTGRVTVGVGTRQDHLLQACAKGSVCGVYFLSALQGFSTQTACQFVANMSENFILSGVEVVAAAAGYPTVFDAPSSMLGLDLASLKWESGERSFYCRSCDGEATFGVRGNAAHGDYSSGLTIIG